MRFIQVEKMARRMSNFELERIKHCSEITIAPPTLTFDTRINVRPRFRAKKFRSEIYIFPRWNNETCPWACELKMYVSYAYYKKGLAKQNHLLQQTILTQGEVKKKFRKDIAMKTHRVR